MNFIKRTSILGILLFQTLLIFAQNDVQIILGPDEIGENQAWTITISVNNDRLKNYDNFPEIQGFRKRGTSTQSQTNIINGQVSSSQSIIMTYVPTGQGTITIPSFKMKVNDKVYSVDGKKIKIGAAVQRQQSDPYSSFFNRDPAQDFFGRGEPEFVDVKEDAILAITTNKSEVYVGEGFTATLSFLVADNNRAPLQFHNLGKQLGDILKKIRPANCWEENFNIENIEGEMIQINGKYYTQYKIYQGTFFPLNAQPVVFPSVGLEMIKYKVAKNPSFFGQNRQEDFKTFYSKPKTVKVKELPPHPLRQSVAVGNYQLEERLSSANLKTGQSAAYEFRIFGEGNISAIRNPTISKNTLFDFYEPNVKQNTNREVNRVTGTKSFNYFMIPKEPGTYALGDYMHWVFFNPSTKKYDTLRSKYTLNITGESQKNQSIESTDFGSFYDRTNTTNNQLHNSETTDWMKIGLNIFILLAIGATAFLLLKK